MTYRYIDPDTFVIVTLDDVEGPDVLPPCPVCGTMIEIDMIEVTTWNGPPAWIEGMWECPNGCDPRAGDPRYLDSP